MIGLEGEPVRVDGFLSMPGLGLVPDNGNREESHIIGIFQWYTATRCFVADQRSNLHHGAISYIPKSLHNRSVEAISSVSSQKKNVLCRTVISDISGIRMNVSNYKKDKQAQLLMSSRLTLN